jgi:hypothetical protein
MVIFTILRVIPEENNFCPLVGAYLDLRGLNAVKKRRILATVGNETSFSVNTVHFLLTSSPV